MKYRDIRNIDLQRVQSGMGAFKSLYTEKSTSPCGASAFYALRVFRMLEPFVYVCRHV